MRHTVMLIASALVVSAMLGTSAIDCAAADPADDKVEIRVTDAWLTATTAIAILNDERIKGSPISVDSDHRVVTLRGKVDSEEAKKTAEALASRVAGVERVSNELQVVPPVERPLVDIQDQQLTSAVRQTLARDEQLGRANIDVRVDAGFVTLRGTVGTSAQSARASELTRQVAGVRAVKNELASN